MFKRKFSGLMALVLALSMLLPLGALSDVADVGGELRYRGLSNLLEGLEAESSDAWIKAIYQAGAQDAQQDGDLVRFNLRSFDPRVKELGKYADDPDGWFAGFQQNASAYQLAVELTLENGEPNAASLKAMKAAVKAAAASAKKAFDTKDARIAICAVLFPQPIELPKDTSKLTAADLSNTTQAFADIVAALDPLENVSPAEAAPLFYAQKSQKMTTTKGPHALSLSCTGLKSPSEMLTAARTGTLGELSRVPLVERPDTTGLRESFATAVATQAIAERKKAKSFSLSIDIDRLAKSEEYAQYIEDYAFSLTYYMLLAETTQLEDDAALDFPKTGRISGSTSGAKVVFKSPKDGFGRYIQMRSETTDKMVVDMFLRPGSSVSVNVPNDTYTLLFATGTTWYGIEKKFGKLTDMSAANNQEIKKSSRRYTIYTLAPKKDGNVKLTGASESDFFSE